MLYLRRLTLIPLRRPVCAAGLSFLALSAAANDVRVHVRGGSDRPAAGAVVFLESRDARAAVRPATGRQIVQRNRQFWPQVSVVPLGSSVAFPNLDTVRHHVYSFSPAKTFELKLYAGTPANPVVFDRSGVVVIGCNIHDAMAGWVIVVDTPYYGQADEQGTVTLAGIPPGHYRLRTWTAELPMGAPALDQPLDVGADPVTVHVRTGG